ncbi:MAG: hypothetical protein MK105_13795, partial [Crocinitomicaceae bacterium]|nr:hypothetical protein [Crocinitomicaceae bacterium]
MKFGFSKVQTKKRFKLLAYYLIFSIVFQLVAPNYSFALTSGPAQEEYASFEPVGTNQMVDLYSGDFTYNIPLLSVPGPNGGYPINLAYHSGVGMEQEASWVGLGWNINMGAINRQLRGLPDDFNGDVVTESVHMKENITVGFNDVLKWLPNRSRSETAGFPDPENEEMGLTMMGDPSSYETNSYRLGLFYNNYKGFGYEYSLGLKGKRFRHITKLKFGLNLNFNSQNGITYSPSVEHGYSINGNKEISASINSRTGFQNLRISRGIGRNRTARVFKLGNTSSLSFGYMPNNVASIQYTYNRQNVPFKFDFGNKSIAKVEYPFPVSGEINISSLGPNGDAVFNRSAYGYLNTEKSEEEDITDFSESQNIRYSKLVPNLAPSTVNYDIYSMTGQGTGGMFRPHKSEIGIYNQQNQTEVNPIANDGSNITGIEIGSSTLPNDFHLGFDTQFGNTTNYSGKWEEENEVNDHLGLNENKDPRKEGTYFQMYGEKTAKYQSENYLNTWSGDDAVSMKLEKTSNYSNRKYQAKGVLKNSAGTETSLSNTLNGKQSKVRRASNIQRLTKSQVQSYGISNYLAYSVDNTPSVNDVNSVNSNVAKSSDLSNVGTNDHINEISVLQSNGMKYVYGLPAYNKTRIDAAFRLPIDQDVLQNGYRITEEDPYPIQKMSRVKNWYANGEIKREGGALDEFVSKTTTPAYAHSWLLTSVLSDDYVDITGDGPTNDDFGYWTKFNYKKVIENYKWRTPYSDANFSSGSFASQRDNIGSYTYGEKDIFYIETVETKTHIAVFELENREDGYEAKGELVDEDESNIHGTNSLKALKSIKLYSKNEYLANPANAIPVKEVHFEYDYSLCPGVPNNINGGGKLTLKKVYFTYEGSNRMEYSPYEFTYSNNNPAYSYQDMDRWGLYKNNSIYQNHYPSGRFPYVDQESPSAVDNWLMTDIKLPSGSNMHVDYEQDSYSFVEGKRPMEMMDIIGINKYANIVPVDGGKHDPSATVAFTPLKGDYVYIKLRESVATREEFSEKYLNKEGLKYVHFRAEVSLSNNLITNDENRKYELINGFGEIDYGSEDSNENPDDYGIVANGTIGYIKLKKLNLGKLGAIKTNPIRKAALQHLNINVPHIKYGEPTQNVTVNIQSLFSPLQDMLGTVLGKYKADIVEGRAEFIRLTGHSQIRMYSPTEKLGGGVRVKQIYVEDDGASGFASQRYGQVYTYEDGVAYEPQIGMEESSLIQPVNYNSKWFNDNNMGGANQFFVKKPVMQDYYPGQSVGYGKVTVQSINTNDYFTSTTDYNHKSITPTVEHEFYTPKDFPVYTDETDLGEHDAIRRVIPLLGLYNKNVKRVARSQGYSIVLNDMAGKPKLTRTIAEKPKNATNGEDKILSSQEYRYQTKSQFNTNGNNRLNNEVTCLNSDGSQVKAVIGETVEIFNVMNENYSKTNSGGLEFNVGVMPSGSLPMLQYITPIPAVTQSEASFKTSVTHKIIHRSGVLKEVEVWDGKSRVVTENLAYDGETGAVINSKVTNEYEDPLYSFNYPAHWNYEALGGAYKNLGSKLNSDHFNTAINNGVLQVNAGYEDLFTPGDELFVSHSNGSDRIHVLEVNGT